MKKGSPFGRKVPQAFKPDKSLFSLKGPVKKKNVKLPKH